MCYVGCLQFILILFVYLAVLLVCLVVLVVFVRLGVLWLLCCCDGLLCVLSCFVLVNSVVFRLACCGGLVLLVIVRLVVA